MRCLRRSRRLATWQLSCCKPSRAFGAELLHDSRFVLRHVLRCESIRPTAVYPPMDEHLRTIVPSGPPQRDDFGRVSLHPVEGAVLDGLLPPRLLDGDVQELCDAAHLIWHIALEVGEVDEQDVRKVANLPPGAHVLPERPEGVAVVFHPVAPVLMDVCGGLLDGRPHTPRRVVESVVPELVCSGVMVVHAPHH